MCRRRTELSRWARIERYPLKLIRRWGRFGLNYGAGPSALLLAAHRAAERASGNR